MQGHGEAGLARTGKPGRCGRPRLLWRSVLVALLALALAGCAAHPQTTLAPESDYANNIQNLFVFTCWAALVVFLVVAGALLVAIVRFRRKPGDGRPRLLMGNRNLEIGWTVAPVIVLTAIAIPTVALIFQSEGPAPAQSLQVTAVGHQWWFEFQYPDQQIVSANEMHIIVGRPVNVALKSADVMHSFWVPKLGGKRDMIPNHTNYLWFTPEKTDTYYAECAEFCGISHANMSFRVVVDTPAQFDAWVQEQHHVAAAPASPQAVAGAQDFMNLSCAGCHTISGTSAAGVTGPNLTHLGSRGTLAAGTLPNNPANLAQWLADPDGIKPGNLMGKVVVPGMLNQTQITDLTAYLESLK